MKKLLPLLLLIIATASTLSAQNFQRRGVSFGADRDTLLYIIASPFDNWYLTIGGGVQTFIGNELTSSARQNKLNYVLKAELGKWIIPDLAVSLRYSFFDVDGQSQYGLQPFINPAEDIPNANGYYPFHAHAMSLTGYVTLDWTNFFRGYEKGRRDRTHIFTPIGLGMSMLFGPQRNPRGMENYTAGQMRRNFELCYSAGIGAEYEVSTELAFNIIAEMYGSESTWDWSPYNNSRTRFDLMPNITIGARIGLLKKIEKRDMYSDRVFLDTVYHYFRSFGTRRTVPGLQVRIENLERLIDSTQNMADRLMKDSADNSATLAAVMQTLDSLQRELDTMQIQPTNIMQALRLANEELGLPATVVYFQLDKYNLDINARKRLQRFARSMAKASDTLEYYIIGAADSLTGSRRHNDWLSERRCEAARNALVNDYDANGNQLIMVPVGGITAYEIPEDNRMAMIILRSPEIDAIIQRWSRYKQ